MLKQLRQRRHEMLHAHQAWIDAAVTAGMKPEDHARDDAFTAELADLDAQIGRQEAQAERMRNVPGLQPSGGPAAGGDGGARFANLGEQLMAVAQFGITGARDSRLSMFGSGMRAGPTGMSEGVSADGGFLVQKDFVSELLQSAYEGGDIMSRINKIPLGPNSNGIKINGVDETSRVSGSRGGGVQAYWTAEAGLKTASQPKFRQISLELDKLTGLCYATDELLQDSVALEAWLVDAFRKEMTFKVEDAIINGTGAGMPMGILNSGAVVTVPKETSQPAATIMAPNILKMWARMPARSRKNAVWLMNQDVESQLLQMGIVVKNVAGTENVGGFALPAGVIYMPPGMNGNETGMLMGRPVIPVEYLPTLGTAGDVILCDLSEYLAIDKGGVASASSIHVRFIYDETVFRFVYRFNGTPKWYQPLTPFKGSATQSPFVVLQAR